MTEILIFYIFSLTVSTFLSMFEVAILTINPIRLRKLSEDKPYLIFFENKKDKAVTDIMSTNFVFDLASAMYISMLISNYFVDNQLYIFIASAVTILGTLYVATLSAKLFASKKSDVVINRMGWLIIGVYWALKPVIVVISGPTLLLLRGVLKSDNEGKLSDGELLGVIAMAKQEGLLATSQHTLIKRVINLESQTVRDILPEGQIIESVDIESSILSLREKIKSGCHKRLVVTKKHNEKHYPIGILMFKDIVQAYVDHLECKSNGEPESCSVPSIASVMRPCLITNEEASAQTLIDKLHKGEHIVVATNAEGVMTGVLQSDDIIRTLVN